MSELEDKLNSILSSPESMEKIMEMAKQFGLGGGESKQAETKRAAHSASPFGDLDPNMLSMLTAAMHQYTAPSGNSGLLEAVKPYLREERAQKLDKAMGMVKLMKVARTVLPEMGGGKGV